MFIPYLFHDELRCGASVYIIIKKFISWMIVLMYYYSTQQFLQKHIYRTDCILAMFDLSICTVILLMIRVQHAIHRCIHVAVGGLILNEG